MHLGVLSGACEPTISVAVLSPHSYSWKDSSHPAVCICSFSSQARMTAQPLRNVTSTEADIRFNLEMRNHVSLGVAVNRLGTDCKDQGKFPCCQEPFRSAQVVKNIGSAHWR